MMNEICCNLLLSRAAISDMQLLFSAMLFGFSFVFQKYAMGNGIGPFAFNAYRFVLSAVLLHSTKSWTKSILQSNKNINEDLPIAESESITNSASNRQLWYWGCICGISMFIAAAFQQIGLVTISSAAKAGFICGSYVIMVPIVLWMMPYYSKKPCKWTWICASICLSGLYLLSGCSEGDVCIGGAMGLAEIYILIGTTGGAFYVIFVDIGTNLVDAVDLTANYFISVSIFSIILAFTFEFESFLYPFTELRKNWVIIVSIAVINSIGSILASLGQMYTQPGHAGLIFSLESVFCAIFSYLFLHERLSWLELIGCLIMFSSVMFYSIISDQGATETETDALLTQTQNTPTITYYQEILGTNPMETHIRDNDFIVDNKSEYSDEVELTRIMDGLGGIRDGDGRNKYGSVISNKV